MNSEATAGYSKDIVYGQLTSPFINKMVHINAHPSVEQDAENVSTYSMKNFMPSKATARVDVAEISSLGASKAKEIHEGNFPPDGTENDSDKLTNFASSKIVKGALEKGYSARESIVIANAAKSYASASKIGVANVLSTHAHES